MPERKTTDNFTARLTTLLAPALLLPLAPLAAFAQQITTSPAAQPPVPGSFPIPLAPGWLLGLSAVALAALSLYALHRSTGGRRVLPLLLIAILVAAPWLNPGLRAQLLASFTNPEGESLPIPVSQVTSGTDIEGFEAADFSNEAGTALAITVIELPTFDQCFPAGPDSPLLPRGPPPPSPPPACATGATLEDGDRCRVDVDTVCRELFSGLAQLTVTPEDLAFTAEDSADLSIGNAASVAAINVGTVIPAGSGLSVAASTCGPVLAAGASCAVTLTAGAAEGPTSITVTADNAPGQSASVTVEAVVVALTAIDPDTGNAAGGLAVTMTGDNLSTATAVDFGGAAASGITVVDNSTVTATSPAHAAGIVDVTVSTAHGDATLAGGFTYEAATVGEAAAGGIVASVLPDGLPDLIAATADASSGIVWGPIENATGALSDTDGAANTATIVSALGSGNSYAAGLCADYEVDGNGNTPCSTSTCYSDWYLPAINQLEVLYNNRDAVGGFTPSGNYWSSTEESSSPATFAFLGIFGGSFIPFDLGKDSSLRTRCASTFAP